MLRCCPGPLSHTGILFTPFGPSCPTLGHSPSRSPPCLPLTPCPRLWYSDLNHPHTQTSSSPNSGSSSPSQATLPPLTPSSFCLARYPPLWVLSYPSKLSYLAGDYASVEMLSFLHHVQSCFPWMSSHPAWVLTSHPGLPSCVDTHLLLILLYILALGSCGSPVLRWTPATLGHTCLSGTDVSRKGSKGKRKTAVGLLVSRDL